MTSASLYHFYSKRVFRTGVTLSLVLGGGLLAACLRLFLFPPADQENTLATIAAEAERVVPPVRGQTVAGLTRLELLQPLKVTDAATDSPDGFEDFRFAGTFFLYAGDGNDLSPSLRRGVLAHLPQSRQHIVKLGDQVAGLTVIRIEANEMVVERAGRQGSLPLGGGMPLRMSGGSAADAGAGRTTERSEDAMDALGRSDGNGMWLLNRDALLAYYDELMNEPERLLHVFDSLAPMYDNDGKITGYELDMVGEKAFFDAMGMQQGDQVREVNSLPMTSRRRAEFFIQQVVENDLSAIVIDLERGNERKRLVYQIR